MVNLFDIFSCLLITCFPICLFTDKTDEVNMVMILEFVFVCAKMEITQSKTNLLSISQNKAEWE